MALVTFDEYGVVELKDRMCEFFTLEVATAELVTGGTDRFCTSDFGCVQIAGLPNANAVCGGYGFFLGSNNVLCGDNLGCIAGGPGPSTNGLCS